MNNQLQYSLFIDTKKLSKDGFAFTDICKNMLIKEFLNSINTFVKKPLVEISKADEFRKEYLLTLYHNRESAKTLLLKYTSFDTIDNFFTINFNVSNIINANIQQDFFTKDELTDKENEAKNIVEGIEEIIDILIQQFHTIGMKNMANKVVDFDQERLNYITMIMQKVLYNGDTLTAIKLKEIETDTLTKLRKQK